MTPFDIAKNTALILDDKKAKNINVIKVEEVSSLSDYMVIATGTSSTQVNALADAVEMKLKEQGVTPYGIEGYRSNGWVLVDYGTVILHIFTTEARDFYDLDRLWEDGEKVEIEFNKG